MQVSFLANKFANKILFQKLSVLSLLSPSPFFVCVHRVFVLYIYVFKKNKMLFLCIKYFHSYRTGSTRGNILSHGRTEMELNDRYCEGENT